MKKKNRPDVPVGAVLTLVYKDGGADTFKRYSDGFGSTWGERGLFTPSDAFEDLAILGWVVVDADGTVTIGPQ